MTRRRPPRSFEPGDLPAVALVFVASVIAIAAALWPAVVDAADEDKTPAETRFRELVPWLPGGFLPTDKPVAFEEHPHFVYLAGRSWASQASSGGGDREKSRIRLVFLRPGALVVDVWPFDADHRDIGKPAAMSTVDVPLAAGGTSSRAVCVYHVPVQETARTSESIRFAEHVCNVAITQSDRGFHLVLPLTLGETARIGIESADGKTILPSRHLPAGVMPYGPEGMRLIERWDSRYRGDSRPGWDKDFPSSHLKAAVEGGVIKPGRAVVLGCGTGTNAVYLATQGFDVTAIDIAPTALNLAEEKAAKANVKVRWLLGDVLAPPAALETFDFIFDRGCYHGVRRNNAEGYVKTVKRLSRPGTHLLILAGSANQQRRYGPPRVREEELRSDFSSGFDFVRLDLVHFDSADPQRRGALAWSALLRRKAEEP